MVEEAQKLDDGSTVDSDQRSASPGEAAGTEGNGTPEETDLEGSSSGMEIGHAFFAMYNVHTHS